MDRAGGVGAEYGVQGWPSPSTPNVNRPSVVIVDQEGIARFAYYGILPD